MAHAATINSVVGGSNGDGYTADVARVKPRGIAIDPGGNLIIADTSQNRVRYVDAQTGIISTIAGTGEFGYSGDGGPATEARLGLPVAVAVDAQGNIYVSDNFTHRVRRISASGVITTYAGTGVSAFGGDGGAATSATISWPAGLKTLSDGSLLIADSGNNRIRKVSPQGIITTVAGNGSFAYNGDLIPATSAALGNPSDVAVDLAENIYIAEQSNCRIRRVDRASGTISTIAGTGLCTYGGDGGLAVLATLNGPGWLATDADDYLYFSEVFAPRVRVIDLQTGIIQRLAGTGFAGYNGDGIAATSAFLNAPSGIAPDDAGNILIAEATGGRVRAVDPEGIIDTVVGSHNGDGFPAEVARTKPKGITLDADGSFVIADGENNRVRWVDAQTGLASTIAGTGVLGYSGDGGPATQAKLALPTGVAITGGGDVYFSDQFNHRVRRISASGTITTVAGTGSSGYSGDGGPGQEAKISWPAGVETMSDGSVLFADSGNNRIRKISPQGIITTVAGNGGSIYNGDGILATSAVLTNPIDVALDRDENLFIVAQNSCRIRRVDAASGIITTIAGTGQCAYSGDGGPATSATLNSPAYIALDDNDYVYVSETFAPRVRRIDLVTGIIDRFAGTGIVGYAGDGGPATSAWLMNTTGLAVDPNGFYLYIADRSAGVIRSVELEGAPPPAATPTRTPTNAPNPTATPSRTPTNALTSTPTSTPTKTPTNAPTRTFTPVPTNTNTPLPTATKTFTPIPTATFTHTPTRSFTPSSTPTPTIQVVNVAVGKAASQSSTLSGGEAAHGVDGNTNGNWVNNSLTHTGSDVEAWWHVDLGAVAPNIVGVDLWNRTDCCGERLRDFYVQVSDLPFASTSLATTLNDTNVSSFFVQGQAGTMVSVPVNRSGRYVRVQLDHKDYLALAEIQVWATEAGTPPPPTATPTQGTPPTATATSSGSTENLALGRPAAQSSTLSGAAASRAVDGNTSGDWGLSSVTHTGRDVEAWWEVDLGALATIQTVDVWNRTDCCGERLHDFYVLVSDVAFVSTDLDLVLAQPGVSAYFKPGVAGTLSSVSVGRTGRYVRVQHSTQEYLSIAEVEVWGSGTGSPPAPTATPTNTPPSNPTSTPTTSSGGGGAGTNIALGKAATQSSTIVGGVASRAVDGVTDGMWSTGSVTHTDKNVEAWWQVDLASVEPIDSVDVWNRTDCCGARLSNFYVFVSDVPFVSNTVSGTLGQAGVFSYFAGGAAGSPTTVPVNRTGRYVRVQLTANEYLSIAEVEIWRDGAGPAATATPTATPTLTSTPSGASSNLAAGKPASQSSTIEGAAASRAVDGNTNGDWSAGSTTHTNKNVEAWWLVDLQSVSTIETIEIYNRTDCCGSRLSNFYVFVSDVPFTSATTAETQAQPGVSSYFVSGTAGTPTTVAVNRSGRYVRVQLTANEYLSIAEVRVIGQ